MITAPLPPDEAERIAELEALHVLDTPAEQRFDRLIALAKHAFDVPIAYLALVDSNRQWFKAQCGMCDTKQTGRDVSFCSHTILRDEPLIIPDALADERFRDHPLVVDGPKLRFYAGVPLKGPGGHNVGTFCIADRKPRELTPERISALLEIAGMAADELNMVRTIEAQRQYMQTQQQLSRELRDAAEYVRSQLPQAIDTDPRGVKADYVYISSSQLGGDMLGYHWLDEHRLAFYILDVTGHGVGASLMSVSVSQGVRQNIHHDDPAALLASLNRAFPMEQHHAKFFTIFYGIFDTRDRTLHYATGGHPPAILLEPGAAAPTPLGQPQLMLGIMDDFAYQTEIRVVAPGSRLYLYTDGAFEVTNEAGTLLGIEGLTRMFAPGPSLEDILHGVRGYQGIDQFADDFSLLQLSFD